MVASVVRGEQLNPGLEQMRSLLNSSGLLADTLPTEFCLVVVPSRRIKSGRFAILMQSNGVRCRAMGHGDGSVRDAKGRVRKVQGILVLAVDRKDARKASLYAKLFGVTAVTVDNANPDR